MDCNPGVKHYYKSGKMDKILADSFYEGFVAGLQALEGTDIKVYSCSPTSRLNKHIPYKEFPNV
jgi:hypothetical protein